MTDQIWNPLLRDQPTWHWTQPDPPPFTTIAWRLRHVIVGVHTRQEAS